MNKGQAPAINAGQAEKQQGMTLHPPSANKLFPAMFYDLAFILLRRRGQVVNWTLVFQPMVCCIFWLLYILDLQNNIAEDVLGKNTNTGGITYFKRLLTLAHFTT